MNGTILAARHTLGAMLPPLAKQRIVQGLNWVDFVKHITPNPMHLSVALPERAKPWLAELREKGIVRIENPALLEVAKELDQRYLARLKPGSSLTGKDFDDPRLFALNNNLPGHARVGIKISCWISFKDSSLKPLLRDPAIAAVLYNYYRRQPYYRNQPVLQFAENAIGQPVSPGNEWHSDHYRQISAMLLISDVTTAGTHMEYVIGSHKRSFLFMREGMHISNEESQRRAEAAKNIFYLTGPKGTLFLYDSTGVHRRNLIPGSSRKALVWTVTTGHHLHTFTETTDDWPELQEDPLVVERMFDKVRPSAPNADAA